MKKRWRVLILCLIIALIGGVAVNLIAEHQLKKALTNQVKQGHLSYANLQLNVWEGTVIMDTIHYQRDGLQVEAAHLQVEKFSFWHYLWTGGVAVQKVIVVKPHLILTQMDSLKKSSKSPTQSVEPMSVELEQLIVKRAQVELRNAKRTILKLTDYTVKGQAISFVDHQDTTQQLTYESLSVTGGQLYYHLGKLHDLQVEAVDINPDDLVINQLRIIPNYSREAYVNVIPYEKDLMKVSLQQLKLHDYQFDFQVFPPKLTVANAVLDSIDLAIYRDKRVADDSTKKKMYSTMLRTMDLQLAVDSLAIHHANIRYEEVQAKNGKTGLVFFENMEVRATNVTNLQLESADFPATKVAVQTEFMGSSSLHVNWLFHVNDPADSFRINGAAYHIPSKAINGFLQPAFNLKAEGEGIQALYFDFYGDHRNAQGNFKMNYRDLKIEVLRKNGQERNGVLTFLANLVLKGDTDYSGKTVHIDSVKRDPTKSFWNYFWKCIAAGLKKTVI